MKRSPLDWRDAVSSSLQYFAGKARVEAERALDDVTLSLADKRWLKGASRRVKAALSKQAVAARWGKTQERQEHNAGAEGRLDDIMDVCGAEYFRSTFLVYRLRWLVAGGSFSHAARALTMVAEGRKYVKNKDESAALDYVEAWATAMLPLAEAVSYLDSLRPAPVFTFLGVSPTVTATLAQSGFDHKTLRLPPVRREIIEETDKHGQTLRRIILVLEWPEGTVHSGIRFHGRSGNSLCAACGHAIKNPFNWVPLLVDNAEGTPHSMWVGGDCARNLLGVRKDGDAEWENVEGR